MAGILVITSPSGHIGSYLLPILYKQEKFRLRLAGHSPASVEKLKTAYPKADVRKVDITSLDQCHQLLEGAATLFHVGPSFHSREKEIGFNMIDAAISESQKPHSNFKHFVYSSVLGTQIRQLMQHDLKSYVEERLMLSTLNWTILQPTNFMEAYPVQLLATQEKPVMERLWNAEGANILNERETHFLAQYPLCSTMPTSDAEVAREIGRQIGRDVEIRTPSFEVGVESVLSFLFGRNPGPEKDSGSQEAPVALAAEGDPRPDITRDEAERLILFYNRRGLLGSPNVMRWLLGKEPTSVAEYVTSQLKRSG